MSEFFIKNFNKRTGCAHCKNGKLRVGKKTYSLCEAHLNEAAERWRNWASYRRQQGRCISCDHKSINGWLRCLRHREINRLKCEKWMSVEANRLKHYANQKARRAQLLAGGLCACPARNPITWGTRCSDCRARSRRYNNNSRKAV